ncbi:hypothetical protein ACNTMW_30750 [Planosporangium sp. 12N6]|uniref:hypothetical protein n=1 Tax=Planosporangium spinosum TaxID=3402278 RepID=UPI003CF1BEA5
MRRLRPLAAVLLTAGAAAPAAGCGISPTEPISFGPAPRASLVAEQVYFVREGRLHPSARQVPPSPASTRRIDERPLPSPAGTRRIEGLDLLAAGPLPVERDAGLTTELPSGIRIIPTERAGGDLTLLLASADERSDDERSDPAGLSELAVAQIACTAAADVTAPARVTLYDKLSGHQRGPVSCPVTLPGRDGPNPPECTHSDRPSGACCTIVTWPGRAGELSCPPWPGDR